MVIDMFRHNGLLSNAQIDQDVHVILRDKIKRSLTRNKKTCVEDVNRSAPESIYAPLRGTDTEALEDFCCQFFWRNLTRSSVTNLLILTTIWITQVWTTSKPLTGFF